MTLLQAKLPTQASGAPLQALHDRLQTELEAVNALILERMQSSIALIPQMAEHLIASGGKRIRPLLVLASAQLVGYSGCDHIKLAACVEFIHTATLLHDDVVDNSTLRRGKTSANALWGDKASVLVGDFLFSRAFELMVEIGSLDVLRVLSQASSRIAEGEVLQLSITGDIQGAARHYFETIEAKTAKLFEAACEAVGYLSWIQGEQIAKLKSYGYNLGMAFQIADDILDYQPSAETGKPRCADFSEGKITLPVLLCWEGAEDEERAFWRRTLQDLQQNPEDTARARACLAQHDAYQRALCVGKSYAQHAVEALETWCDPVASHELEMKSLLQSVALYSVERMS